MDEEPTSDDNSKPDDGAAYRRYVARIAATKATAKRDAALRSAHLRGLEEARDLAWSMYSSAATLMPRVDVTLPIIEAIDSRIQQLK